MNDIDENTTKQDVIILINQYLTADDGEPNDAEKIYEHFYNKGIHWLIAEVVLAIAEEDSNWFNEIAAELDD